MRGGWDAKHVPSHWLDSFLCMCMRLLWEFRPGAHGAAVQRVSAFAPCCLLPVACWVFGVFGAGFLLALLGVWWVGPVWGARAAWWVGGVAVVVRMWLALRVFALCFIFSLVWRSGDRLLCLIGSYSK